MKLKLKLLTIAILAIAVTTILTSLKIEDIDAKDFKGAWEQGAAGKRTVMIVTEKVYSIATYDDTGKKFISATGGTWSIDGDKLVRNIEWNTNQKKFSIKICVVK